MWLRPRADGSSSYFLTTRQPFAIRLLAPVGKTGRVSTLTSASAGVARSFSLSTKKIKGLHMNDFIMASKIDRVRDRSGRSLDR
jgi:Pterin 4 alpha carbinolamine dehydratase